MLLLRNNYTLNFLIVQLLNSHIAHLRGATHFMTEFEETGLDPEHIFNEGQVAGQLDLQEQLGARLQDELGLSPEETQALFDPAPRRGRKGKRGKVNCSAKQMAKMPQICKGVKSIRRAKSGRTSVGRTYDPAPRNPGRVARVTNRVRRRASGMVNRVLPYVPLAVGAGTFYSLYSTRATDLKAAGKLNKDGTPVDGVVDAIMYDINNYTANGGTTGSIDRLKDELPGIIIPLIAGFAVSAGTRGTRYSKYGNVANKSLVAYAAAVAGKAILDPPLSNTRARSPAAQVQVTSAPQNVRAMTAAPQQVSGWNNPY